MVDQLSDAGGETDGGADDEDDDDVNVEGISWVSISSFLIICQLLVYQIKERCIDLLPSIEVESIPDLALLWLV